MLFNISVETEENRTEIYCTKCKSLVTKVTDNNDRYGKGKNYDSHISSCCHARLGVRKVVQ